MKKYTIKPLEWEGPEYWQYSRVLSGTYHACVRGSSAYWSFNPHSDADDAVSGCPDTIAAIYAAISEVKRETKDPH